jgi:ABC-type sugar transport system substrate-binding protein
MICSRAEMEEHMVGIKRRTLTLGMLAGLVPGVSVMAKADGTRTVALLIHSLDSPFAVTALATMQERAKQAGWKTLQGISDKSDAEQLQQVKAMISRKVDGIIIMQSDAKAVIPAIKAANAANVPMVHFNRAPAPNRYYSVAVVADNEKIAEDVGDELAVQARKAGGKYNVCHMIGDLGDANAIERRDGFQKALEANKDIFTVVAEVATRWDADTAFAGLTNAIQAHPDINLIFTPSDFMDPQIEQALQTAGKWFKTGEKGHVMLGGFMQAGYVDAIGVQNLFLEVKLCFQALREMWAGQKPPKIVLDPGFVITPATLITKRDEMWGYAVWKSEQKG